MRRNHTRRHLAVCSCNHRCRLIHMGFFDRPFTVSFDELLEMPSVTLTFDIHCVTEWIPIGELLAR